LKLIVKYKIRSKLKAMMSGRTAKYLAGIKKQSIFSLTSRFSISKILFSAIIITILTITSLYLPAAGNIYASDNSKIIICIDPGHGGKDTGTIGPSGLKEKDANLDISIRLRDKLSKAGFKVIMTRDSDINHSLEEITGFANSSNAYLFISVHNNSHPSPNMNGTQTFYYGKSAYGTVLASILSAKVREQTGTVDMGVRAANFRVLRDTAMVAALVEGVFMSNPDEEAKLNDKNFRDKIAEGIFNGIIEYLNKYGKNVSVAKKLATAQSFVNRVYQKSLNVDPDQATIDNWAKKLDAGQISYADVIRGIINSKQFTDRNLGNEQYISVLYAAVLDRSPDANGKTYWLGQLKSISRIAVLESFLSSAEFRGLVNQYSQYGYIYTGTTGNGSSNGTSSGTNSSQNTGTVFSISVLNGNGVKGIATKASGVIKEIKNSDNKSKYNIVQVADANSYGYGTTQIICKSGNGDLAKAAEEIKNALGAGTVKTQDKNGSQSSDIVVIIGKDYLQTGQGTGLIHLNVLNGQGTPGIAASVKVKIESTFNKSQVTVKVTETKNADNFGYKKTKIIVFTKKTGVSDIASALKNMLGVGEISESTSGNTGNVDISVILGSDYKG
jgi:N-acetylmuramoyl-L-alanine amidase